MAKIFIGSSSESLNTAKIIKDYFKGKHQCTIWKDHFFELNESTYETLIKKSVAYDYAIFVGGVDDSVMRIGNRKKRKAIRDNVYLEFGLYAGVLSKERTFFFVDKKTKIASDLIGIDLIFFETKKEVLEGCSVVEQKIEDEEKINRISLLPSTSLAYIYYNNFLNLLSDTCFIDGLPEIDVDKIGIDAIKIIVPNNCNIDWKIWAKEYFKHHNCADAVVKIVPRNISIKYDTNIYLHKHKLILLDIPQILNASFWAVDAVMGKNYIGAKSIVSEVKNKEVSNFVKTLNNLINKNPFLAPITEIITISDIKQTLN